MYAHYFKNRFVEPRPASKGQKKRIKTIPIPIDPELLALQKQLERAKSAEYRRNHQSLPEFRFRSLNTRAKARALSVTLTLDDCLQLWQQCCVYCNDPCLDTKSGYGLDRVDSDKGYTLDNVVPCCSVCNRAKLTMSTEAFDTWIAKVYNHRLN